MNILDLETPLSTEKLFGPQTEDMYPFYITEYGKTFKNTPCYQLRMNSYTACVQYVISGSGIIICDDKIYTVSGGDTFILPQGSNQIYYSNPDNQFERIWLNFNGKLAASLLKIYGLSGAVVFPVVDTQAILEEIQATCRRISDAQEYKNKTAALFLKLVQYISDNRKAGKNAPPEANERIRLYIDSHIMENIKISDIARRFSFSEEHIIRIFKKTYGVTPHQYILQSKIRLAMIMLKTADLSIEQIAERLNFSNSQHFSAQFKRLMGYKPTQYREMNSGK